MAEIWTPVQAGGIGGQRQTLVNEATFLVEAKLKLRPALDACLSLM